jgi:hypothetical protein
MSATVHPRETIVPEMTDGGHTSVQTNATGANFSAFASQNCKQLTISNNSGTAIEVQQDGAGVALPIPDQTYFTFYGLANASQLGVRRVDQSNTQVTIAARWEK